MAYVGNQPVPQATQTRDRIVATSGQTSFATSGYTPQFVDVYLDGVKLDSSEYTATNGSDIVLNSGATTGQVLEVVAFSSFDVADIRNMTQPLGLKNYTTTERNALTTIGAGDTIYNSTSGSVEFYDGSNWIATNLIPSITSITGDIYSGLSSTLTLSLINATDTIDVKYYEGGTLLATDSGVTVTSGSATSTVPSAVYTQTVGDTISIQIFNQDGTPSSNSINKTVISLPTGGTITSYGGYRVHTFTSSGTFTNTLGSSLTCDVLVVGGGGGGGNCNSSYQGGGGGGAGGFITSSGTSGGNTSPISPLTITSGAHTVTVGAGGAGGTNGEDVLGASGSNSSFSTVTALGGGRGGANTKDGASGGSGGGGKESDGAGQSGTSGQGFGGGNGSEAGDRGGGGGGAGQAGQNWNSNNGRGGNGIANSLRTGSPITYAGGGGAGYTTIGSNGGSGGGGGASTAGTANTGGGGGADADASNGAAAGGSGIVVIRYQL